MGLENRKGGHSWRAESWKSCGRSPRASPPSSAANCEVVVHDLSQHPDHTIVAIENGHVSGRKVGDGASNVVLERMEHQDREAQDHLSYLTRTPDGKILKSSTIYIRNSRGKVTAILAINFDISALMMAAGRRRGTSSPSRSPSRRSRRRSSTSTTCWRS